MASGVQAKLGLGARVRPPFLPEAEEEEEEMQDARFSI